MATWEFPGSEPIEMVIEIASGSVAVSGEPGPATTVTVHSSRHGDDDPLPPEELQVSFTAGRLEIIQPKSSSWLRGHATLDVTVQAPAGSRGTLRTASADVSCVGDLAELEARTASGDVTVASVGGAVAIRTASGDVRLRRAGADAAVVTASGDARIGEVAGSVTAQTASGDVAIGSVTAGETNVKTATGDVSVGVARGAEVYLDLASLTGSIHSQLEEAAAGEGIALRVTCRSISGDIQISRAAATADAQ
jgi:Putative adhesin